MLHAAHAGRALRWRYPLAGVAVAQPLQRPLPLTCRARQPLQTTLELPIPGLDPAAVDEAFSRTLTVTLTLTLTLTLTSQYTTWPVPLPPCASPGRRTSKSVLSTAGLTRQLSKSSF